MQSKQDLAAKNKIIFRQPEEVAQMVLRAVGKNRAMVITDETRRHYFQSLYVDVVMQAFDDAQAFADEQKAKAS